MNLVDKILYEFNEQVIKESTQKDLSIVKSWVNNHMNPQDLLKLKLDNKFKYQGPAYRLIKLDSYKLKEVLKELKAGKSFKEKGKILSFSKSLKGLQEVFYNMNSDDPEYFKYALVIKENITYSNCIVDVEKFDKYNKDLQVMEYDKIAYKSEEEIICKNNFLVTSKNLFGYHENWEFKKYNQKTKKFNPLLEKFIYNKVKSSNLKRIGYDSDTLTLEIEFLSGNKYSYSDVPKSVFLGLKNSISKGKYFWKKIRNTYNYEKIY